MRIATFVVPARLEDAILAMATDVAGGATAWDARGAWDSGDGIVREPVTVVRVAAARLTLASLAGRIARALALDGESTMYCEGPDGLAVVCELGPVRAALEAQDRDAVALACSRIVRVMLTPDASLVSLRTVARVIGARDVLAGGMV